MSAAIKKGDMILFFAGDTWLSKSISYLTNSEVTHAAMVYSDDAIIEILADGVQVNKIADWNNVGKGKKAYVMRHKPELDYAPLKRSADAYLNADVSYDFPGLYLLGALLIYNKFVPTARFMKCTEFILEMAVRQLDHAIQKQIRHNPGKAMVCSQFIYQLFYDCGGDYRIPIVDGCFSLKKNTNACCPGEICLAELLEEQSMDGLAEADNFPGTEEREADFTSGIPAEDAVENAARELYLALTDSGQANDAGGLLAGTENTDRVLSLAGRFLDKLKELKQRAGADLPLDAMFVTVADLASHAPSLERIGAVYIERA
ncbi:MAG: hypothetical protein K2O16_18160 [Lachnospiraceae bacterium]|nr:hypothetical protein [Lachnospiraceae bacterium]